MKRQHVDEHMVLPRKTEKANMDRAQLLSLIDWDRMDRIDRMQAECYSMHESGMSYDEIARRMGCCMTPDEVKEMEDFFCESRRKKYKLSLVNAQKNRDAVKVALWKSEQDRMMKATRSSRGQFAAKA